MEHKLHHIWQTAYIFMPCTSAFAGIVVFCISLSTGDDFLFFLGGILSPFCLLAFLFALITFKRIYFSEDSVSIMHSLFQKEMITTYDKILNSDSNSFLNFLGKFIPLGYLSYTDEDGKQKTALYIPTYGSEEKQLFGKFLAARGKY